MGVFGLIVFLIIGAIAGYIARAVVPGKDDLGFLRTVLLGVVGSFVGGFLGALLFGWDGLDGLLQTSGLIGSVIGAIVALLIYNAAGGRKRVRA